MEETKSSPAKTYSKNYIPTKACFNPYCPTENPKLSKIKLRCGTKWMCPTCENAYRNDQFCFFCETIYFLDYFSDNKIWIGCDNPSCERWVHLDCDERLVNYKQSSIENIEYICPHCESIKQKGKRKLKDGNGKKKVKKDESYSEFIPAFNASAFVCLVKQIDFASIYVKIPETFDQVLTRKKSNKTNCEKFPLISNLLTSAGTSEIDSDLQFCIDSTPIEQGKAKTVKKESKGGKGASRAERKPVPVAERRNLRSKRNPI